MAVPQYALTPVEQVRKADGICAAGMNTIKIKIGDNMKRRIFVLVSALMFVLSGLNTVATSAEPQVPEAAIAVYLDGGALDFDVPPLAVSGRTLVPFRKIFEALGYTVTWDADTQSAIAVSDTQTITLQLDSTTVTRNEETYQSDIAPLAVDGRILVPVRLVSELSNCDVLWNSETQTVTIYHRQAEDHAPVPSTYEYIASDGEYLYTMDNKGGTVQISLADLTVKKTIPYSTNDYAIHEGVLYGRFGLATRASYAAYDVSTGEVRSITEFDVAETYLYNGHIYYKHLEMGPYKTTLCRMEMDGSGETEIFQSSYDYPLSGLIFAEDKLFSNYSDAAFMLPLDTLEPFDFIGNQGLNHESTFVNDMAISGTNVYAALAEYRSEAYPITPLGILHYNYQTNESRLIPMEVCMEELVATDNSIYYSVETEKYAVHNIYRCDQNGQNSVLVAEHIYRSWILSGNYIYGVVDYSEEHTALTRFKTDGSGSQTILLFPR